MITCLLPKHNINGMDCPCLHEQNESVPSCVHHNPQGASNPTKYDLLRKFDWENILAAFRRFYSIRFLVCQGLRASHSTSISLRLQPKAMPSSKPGLKARDLRSNNRKS